jgi:GNAT superfamily N-acetyltransferase
MNTYKLKLRAASVDEANAAKVCLTEHAAEVGGVAPTRRQGNAGTMWDDDVPFAVLVRSHNQMVGGLIGKIFFNWLGAELGWVEKPFHGSGIGKAVLWKAEEKARNLGLTGIYLWTESWQAPEFYQQLGYEQFAEFDNFPPGHKRLGFRKYL